jgi:uncharacterized protein YaiI (UPF0178 family)
LSTSVDRSIAETTSTGNVVYTPDVSITAEEVEQTTTQISSTTEGFPLSKSADSSITGEIAVTTTTGNVVYTPDVSITADSEEVEQTPTQISSTTEGFPLSTSVDSSITGEIAETTTTGNVVYTPDVSITAEEVEQTTTQISSTTEEFTLSTSVDSSFTGKIAVTTTTGNVVYTPDVSILAEEVEQTTTQISSTTEGFPLSTSLDSSIIGEISEATTTGNVVYTPDVSITAEEVEKATTQISSTSEGLLLTTSVDSAIAGENTPIPKVYEAVIDYLNFTSLPPGCFESIDQRCLESDNPEDFSCLDNEISRSIAIELLVDFSLEIDGYLNESPESVQANSSIIHNATCQNSTESSWTEEIKVFTDNGTAIIIEISPKFTTVSFVQKLHTTSFRNSSVLLACYFVNGEAQKFSSIVGGIVSGYKISESQYDCTGFVTANVVESSTVPGNLDLSTSSTAMNVYHDLPFIEANSPDSSISPSGKLILYLGVAVGASVVLAIVVVFWVLRRRRNKKGGKDDEKLETARDEQIGSTFTRKFDSSKSKPKSAKKMKLKLIVKLDSGGFGEVRVTFSTNDVKVWKGRYMDEPVAVKMILKTKISEANKYHLVKMMNDEAALMHKLKHPRIGTPTYFY